MFDRKRQQIEKNYIQYLKNQSVTNTQLLPFYMLYTFYDNTFTNFWDVETHFVRNVLINEFDVLVSRLKGFNVVTEEHNFGGYSACETEKLKPMTTTDKDIKMSFQEYFKNTETRKGISLSKYNNNLIKNYMNQWEFK